jgi:hypothetical protein
VSQLKSWFLCLFIFIGGFLLGSISNFHSFTRQQIVPWTHRHFRQSQYRLIVNQYPTENDFEYEIAVNKAPIHPLNIHLINPFVIPGQDNEALSHHLVSQRKRAILEYLGTVETDHNILGLVKITTTGDSLIVSEEEDLIEEGIIIQKITPKTLTYSKDGIDQVIRLGGI